MLIQELLTITAHKSVSDKFNEVLLEDINRHLLTAVAMLKHRKPGEEKSTKGLDFDTLAMLITGLKIISKEDYRSAMTKDDVGINPNNFKELLDLLNQVPNAPGEILPKQALTFFTAVCHHSTSALNHTKSLLKRTISDNPAEVKTALAELTAFSTKVDLLVNKLHTATKSKAPVKTPAIA